MGKRPITNTSLTTNPFSSPMPFGQYVQADARATRTTEFTDDDLLSDLALAGENVRARQVFEWELKRRATGIS
jgi:hypothetical protein